MATEEENNKYIKETGKAMYCQNSGDCSQKSKSFTGIEIVDRKELRHSGYP